MKFKSSFVVSALILSALSLSACSSDPEKKLAGKRIEVLPTVNMLDVNPNLGGKLPVSEQSGKNKDWPQVGGISTHFIGGSLSANESPSLKWSVSAGNGNSYKARLLSPPVSNTDSLFVIDTRSVVGAFDPATGKKLWEADLGNDQEDSVAGFGGGLAVLNETLFATTGLGEVIALSTKDGSILWKQKIGVPLRGAPVLTSDHLYITTFDNRIFALDYNDKGRTLWSYKSASEKSTLLTASIPAAFGDVVLVPLKSAEVVAVRSSSGQMVWTQSLQGRSFSSALSQMTEGVSSPVIAERTGFIGSSDNKLLAIDIPTGQRVWSADISTINTPWVTSNGVYVVSTEGVLAGLSREDGTIAWSTNLPRNPEDKKQVVQWFGPLLVNDTLVLTSSMGQILWVSAEDGSVKRSLESVPSNLPPIISNGVIYVLGTDGTLAAYE